MATVATLPGAVSSAVRLGAPAPPGGESAWQRLLREEAQARENNMQLAERLRAAREAIAPRGFDFPGGETVDSPVVVDDGSVDADSEGAPEGGFCAKGRT